MKLSDLFLNRFLYKDTSQNSETKDSTFVSADSSVASATPISSGGAAQDINTGNVYIDGNQIDPNTIPQATLDVSNWGWTQTCIFSTVSANQVNWGSGSFVSAGGITYSISSGNTGTMSTKTYIYLDLNVSSTAYQHTTVSGDSVGIGKVLIAVAQNNATAASYTLNVATQIVADNLIANSIDASKIVAGSITATQISSSYIYAGNISATQITTGTLTGIIIQTQSTGQRVVMSSSEIDFYDSSNVFGGFIYGASNGLIIEGQQYNSNILIYGGSSAGVALGYNNSATMLVNSLGVYPNTDGATSLGNSAKRWGDVYAYIGHFASTVYGGNIYGDLFGSNGATLNLYRNGGSNLAGSFGSGGLTVYGANGLYLIGSNKIDFQSYTLTMNANKTAIIPTSKGYNALYCTESPEVWFMDFCGEDKKLDSMFEEVSTGPYRYIKCEDGGYQVWGKRKGHEKFRFESKTFKEYFANERFLNMNKPENQ